MTRFLSAVGALMLMLAIPDQALARGGHAIHAGGMRVAGGSFIRGGGWGPGMAARPGWGIAARPGWGAAWRPGWGAAWRPGWGGGYGRRGYGWGYPLVAAGIGLGFGYYGNYGYSSYYYDEPYDRCLAWNGWRWVNVCYAPYRYGW
jgi:hypothetical protein